MTRAARTYWIAVALLLVYGLVVWLDSASLTAGSAGTAEQNRQAARPRISASDINEAGPGCGGSDSFSGITANPALGVCSDMLAEIGASAVLAETTEIFGAEHLLTRRAVSTTVAEKLLDRPERHTGHHQAARERVSEAVPREPLDTGRLERRDEDPAAVRE